MDHATEHEYIYHIATEADYDKAKPTGTYSHESLATVRTK